MRRKLDAETKRNQIIGIKVKQELKKKLEYIAGREQTTLSTYINHVLEKNVNDYFKIAHLDWEKILREEGNNDI